MWCMGLLVRRLACIIMSFRVKDLSRKKEVREEERRVLLVGAKDKVITLGVPVEEKMML